MQGLLELSGIPYAGCDIQSSALCMDKSLTYMVARAAGIATPNFWTVTASDDIDRRRAHVSRVREAGPLGLVVRRQQGLVPARAAERGAGRAAYDAKVLIEEAVAGSEVGCAILGNDPDLLAGEVDQIALSHGFFRIHQEDEPERGSDNATVIVPADISEASRSLVQETAKAVYRALGCRGLARVDMFLDGGRERSSSTRSTRCPA